MAFRRRIFDYGLALALLLLPLTMLRTNLDQPESLNSVDRAVLHLASPLQRASVWLFSGMRGTWQRYVWLTGVERENRELRRDNARLEQERATLAEIASEVTRLEALLDLRSRTNGKTIGARVVAAPVNPFFRVTRLLLDRGQEVQPGMAVVSEHGLVGRIHHLYGAYADVLLVSDPASSVDVKIARTNARGVLTGLSRQDAYRCSIEYLDRGADVKVGDLVVTSGLGGVFPAGIPVGFIASIKDAGFGLYQSVEVRPSVPFGEQSIVLVLTGGDSVPPTALRPETGRL